MVPSEADAQGLARADKHPKSTRYGRKNPISERWNSEEQLAAWRAVWADVSNRCLERAGHEERIDHRSHADRGLTEQPTIHEGVVARALEKKGIISDTPLRFIHLPFNQSLILREVMCMLMHCLS